MKGVFGAGSVSCSTASMAQPEILKPFQDLWPSGYGVRLERGRSGDRSLSALCALMASLTKPLPTGLALELVGTMSVHCDCTWERDIKLISNFVCADQSLRYTQHVTGMSNNHKTSCEVLRAKRFVLFCFSPCVSVCWRCSGEDFFFFFFDGRRLGCLMSVWFVFEGLLFAFVCFVLFL